MAESADILRAPHQKVLLPDLAAGCSMADMAAPDQLECAGASSAKWACDRRIEMARVIPVTYINSTAGVKAFVGKHGGIVCTSTNAAGVMTWAWERGEKAADAPRPASRPEHRLQDGCAARRDGGVGPDEVWAGSRRSRCQTREIDPLERLLLRPHAFTVAQIDAFRNSTRAAKVIAHPECTFESCRRPTAADRPSTSSAPSRQPERNGVGGAHRGSPGEPVAHEVAADQTVVTLDPFGCLCSTMFRVSPTISCGSSKGCSRAQVHNQIVVPEDQKRGAGLAARSHAGSQNSLRRQKWRMKFHRSPMITRRSNRTSTRRRWRSITTSITRRTSPT